jgi:predicted PurR-regulated permease PerM
MGTPNITDESPIANHESRIAPSEIRSLIRYALVGLLLTAILGWVLFLARGALLIVYVSALFAIGLSPLVEAIERHRPASRRRLPRWAAILIIYLTVIGVLVGIGVMVIPPLLMQAQDLSEKLPTLLHNIQQWLIDHGLMNRELTVTEAVQKTPVGGSDAVPTVLGAVWGVIGGIFGAFTILILTFYLLVDSGPIVSGFVRLFPRPQRARVRDACSRVTSKVSAWLGGQLLLGAIIGTTAAIGLWLLGVPYFYVLALLAGIGEMIPVIGPVLSAIPALIVALTVKPMLALFVLIFFFAQQQLENHILVPKIMSRQVGVSAALVIISLMVGGSMLGIIGALLAVPTAAILQVLLEEVLPDSAPDSSIQPPATDPKIP